MWVYVPGTRQVLRISPQQRVLGGVASADVARMVFSLDYRLDSVEELAGEGGERRRRLNLSRRSKGAAYARIELLAGGEEARPLEADLFAATGSRRLKTTYFEGYREVLGGWRPTVLRVIDHVKGGGETILEYSDFALEDTPRRLVSADLPQAPEMMRHLHALLAAAALAAAVPAAGADPWDWSLDGLVDVRARVRQDNVTKLVPAPERIGLDARVLSVTTVAGLGGMEGAGGGVRPTARPQRTG